MTTVSHSSLTAHSTPFSLSGSTVSASVSGTSTIATIIDPPELQQLVNSSWRSLDPPVKFTSRELGGTKQGKFMPAATAFRWTVPIAGPSGGHTLNTLVTSA